MTTLWLHRINVIIPNGNTEQMNALWTIIGPEGDAEARTFGVPLSATGQEPVTHNGISTAATEEMRILIQEIFANELAGAIVSVQPYTENNWAELLVANGLRDIQPEEIV